jgi:GT2 family glycosyltransferase
LISAFQTTSNEHNLNGSLYYEGFFKIIGDVNVMPVAIIIINWNSGSILRQCIEAIAVQSLPPKRIILVDNASSDQSLSGLETILPQLEIHRMPHNLGFAAGNNFAVGLVEDCEWLALLNPDAIPAPNWLEKLIDATISFPDYSSYASCMIDYYNSSKLDGSGDAYHTSGLAWRHLHGQTIGTNHMVKAPREIFSCCAGAALYRRMDFLDIDGFDEHFFCYFEDVDFGFRLQLTGRRSLYVPGALVRHAGSASTGKKSDFSVYHGHRNLVWTYFKNMPWPLFWLYLPQHLLLNLVSLLWFTCKGKGKVILQAKTDALIGLPDALKKRKKIQSTRKVSSFGIRRLMTRGLVNLSRRKSS